jgi:hypothetical protein
MACNVLARKSMGLVFYCPSMKNVAKNFLQRGVLLMSRDSLLHSNTTSSCHNNIACKHPDFPLPGNVAVDLDELEIVEHKEINETFMRLGADDNQLRCNVVMQYLTSFDNEEGAKARDDAEKHQIEVNAHSPDKVECKIETCPSSLKRDFQRFFERRDRDENLTVLTISQRTENDMSVWSEQVEEEREALIGTFVQNASNIVEQIEEQGYWSDFVDPCSGQPFNGNYKNEALFETDDRFNQLGFRIEDLGCCKAIAHKQWGTHVFVGVLFTDAPLSAFSFPSSETSVGECSL